MPRDRKTDLHRRVAETALGRPLTPADIVHHKDENKANNTPANLEVQTRGAHTILHNKTRKLGRFRAVLRQVSGQDAPKRKY